jgi:hypothetical protein
MTGDRRLYQSASAGMSALGLAFLVGLTVSFSVAMGLVFLQMGSTGAQIAPNVQMRADEPNARLFVVAGEQNADWSRLSVSLESMVSSSFGLCVGSAVDATPLSFVDEPGPHVCSAGVNQLMSIGTGKVRLSSDRWGVRANDYLEFCGQSEASSVFLRLSDVPTHETIGRYSFARIAACQ